MNTVHRAIYKGLSIKKLRYMITLTSKDIQENKFGVHYLNYIICIFNNQILHK